MSKAAPCNEECYQQVAQELNMPLSLIREIITIQSLLTVQVIQEGSFDSIALPYLGKIRVKPEHVQQINEQKGKSEIHRSFRYRRKVAMSA